MTTPIHVAAQAVAGARHLSEIAQAAVTEAEAHVAKLIDRSLDLQAKKIAIAAERSSGCNMPCRFFRVPGPRRVAFTKKHGKGASRGRQIWGCRHTAHLFAAH
jgi:hypothetical protein